MNTIAVKRYLIAALIFLSPIFPQMGDEPNSKKSMPNFKTSLEYFTQGEEEQALQIFFEVLSVSVSDREKEPALDEAVKDWNELIKTKPSNAAYTGLWFLNKAKEQPTSEGTLSKMGTLNLEKYLPEQTDSKLFYIIGAYYSLQKKWEKTDEYLQKAYNHLGGWLIQAKTDTDFEFYFKHKKYAWSGIEARIKEENKKPKLSVQNGHTGQVTHIAYSMDGQTLATAASSDHTVKIWSIDGKLLSDLKGHTGFVANIAYSYDGKTLATASNDKTAKIWSINGKLLHELKGHTEGVNRIIYSPDSKTLATASQDHTAKIWSLDGKLLFEIKGHTSNVTHITYSPDGKTLATGSEDNTVKIWNLDGTLLHDLKGHTKGVNYITYSPDGKTIATASLDKTAKIWSLDGKLLHDLTEHTGGVNHITYSPDGKTLASASYKTATIWSLDGKLLYELEHTDELSFITYSPDGKTLTTASYDKTAKIWSLDGKLLYNLEGHTGIVNHITYSPDGKTLATASWDHTVKIWSVDGKLLYDLKGHTSSVYKLTYSPDGKMLATASQDKTAKIWTIDGKLLYKLNTGFIKHITFSPDGKTLASASYETAKIWSIDGKLLYNLEGHTGFVNHIAYSPDGKTLATASGDATAKIWSIDGKLLHNLQGHTALVNHITYSPDGKTLATASDDETAKIWSIDGKLLYDLKGHIGAVKHITYSPDGKTVATASWDNTAKIWSIDGKLLYQLKGHADEIRHIKYSPDGKTLATASLDKSAKIWGIDGKLLYDLKHTGMVNQIVYSPDGKYIITASSDTTVRIWKLELNPTTIQILHSHSGIISSLHFINNGHTLVTSSDDNTIKYWDWDAIVGNAAVGTSGSMVRTNGRSSLRATQMFFNDDSSLLYTEDGYFDYRGKSALDYVSYRSELIQSGFIDLQDLRDDYYYEDLLKDILSGNFKPNKKKSAGLTKSVETVPIIKPLFEKQKKLEYDGALEPLEFQVKENGSELDSVLVFVNGVQAAKKILSESEESVEVVDDSEEKFKTYRFKVDLPLVPGTNRVEIKAYNKEKIPQSYPVFELQRTLSKDGETAKPDLYLLSVGINEYRKSRLHYSKADALAFSELISQNGKDLYRNIIIKNLTDTDASKKGIEDVLDEFVSRARPEDVVLVYLSGHGMNAFTREGKKIFYFVPQDFPWPNDPETENAANSKGITADYLNDVFTRLRSHKVVLILDACHSGSVNTVMASRGSEKEKATRKAMEKMANGTGRFIFASSSGSEESREHEKVGHGLYTYVLLNALGKNNDKKIPNADLINKDGYIYLSELKAYIEGKFEEQTEPYLNGIIQTPPAISLGRRAIDERINDFPLIRVK